MGRSMKKKRSISRSITVKKSDHCEQHEEGRRVHQGYTRGSDGNQASGVTPSVSLHGVRWSRERPRRLGLSVVWGRRRRHIEDEGEAVGQREGDEDDEERRGDVPPARSVTEGVR